jgi:hypothetical protein
MDDALDEHRDSTYPCPVVDDDDDDGDDDDDDDADDETCLQQRPGVRRKCMSTG